MLGADPLNEDSPEPESTVIRTSTVTNTMPGARTLARDRRPAVVTVTLDGVALSWSREAQLMLGYDAHEILGLGLGFLFAGPDNTLAELRRRVSAEPLVEMEVELCRKDGTTADAILVATHFSDGSDHGDAMAFLFRDISKAKELERRFLGLGQLEAMASMAAGVTHDLNNILTMVGAIHACVVKGGELSREQSRNMKVARDALQRGAALVGRLLGLSERRALALDVVDLNDVVQGVDDLLRGIVEPELRLSVAPTPEHLCVRAATGQLDQILLNLALNARDAMSGQGTLSISVRSSCVAAGHPLFGTIQEGTYGVLSVKDTGCGIDRETLARAFEPFFTTKPVGKGTGLGLVIVKDLVEQLGGALQVESAPGHGADFQVYLPVVDASRVSRSRRASSFTKTILVVDDDAAIRDAVPPLLRAEGYTVLVASDCFEGGDLAAGHEGPIDLLVCDPDLSEEAGRRTMLTILAGQPNLAFLFVSKRSLRSDSVKGGFRTLGKPFTGGALLDAVREVFESQRPPAK